MVSPELLGLYLCKFPPLGFDVNPPVNNLHSLETSEEKGFFANYHKSKKKITYMIPVKEIELIIKVTVSTADNLHTGF